jgi:uncharacterized protein (TIGR03067 family)
MRYGLLLGLVFVGGAAVGQEPAKPTPPTAGTAGKEFNGVWSPVSVMHGGMEMMPTAESRESIRLSVTNGVYSLFYVVDPKEGTGRRLATAAFDADAKTTTFVLTFQGGVKNGQKVHGIYELKGEDLKVCYTPDTNPKPTTFESAKGADVFCESWKRVKK